MKLSASHISDMPLKAPRRRSTDVLHLRQLLASQDAQMAALLGSVPLKLLRSKSKLFMSWVKLSVLQEFLAAVHVGSGWSITQISALLGSEWSNAWRLNRSVEQLGQPWQLEKCAKAFFFTTATMGLIGRM